MAAPVAGVGFLIVNDLLSWASYSLIQNPVNTTVPLAGIGTGAQTVLRWDPSMYVGAQVLVGVLGGDLEVVTITATVPGTSFSAVFANIHVAGEPILGATFSVRQPTDPLFTQAECIQYLSNALNDFLTDVPLYYEVTDAISVAPGAQNVPLPADCQYPVRVAANTTGAGFYPLRETSQSNLDSMFYLWTQQGISEPRVYFRDKVPIQNIGVWPRAGNTTPLEIVYAGKAGATLGLADGFPIPDPFLLGPFYRLLSFCYSKDGEMKNPGLARYWKSRYDFFVKLSNVFLGIVNDPNAEMAAQ